ncbi:MAG: hypothetical protein IJ774_09640 [Selenomonadaceae bacterium]|nr:hypothetical protein [Selenomonadaceae bacterium]
MIGKREFGDYQTPLEFAAKICRFLKVERNVKPSTVLEPTCGVGNFLRASLEFDAEKYFGIEINPAHCKTCAENLIDERVKIVNANFFDFDLSALPKDNLLVIGNPPWVNNETLSKLNSANLPPKSNFKRFNGLDALTGAANFDICEYILLKIINACRDTSTTVAALCKTSTARNVFKELRRVDINFSACEIFEFDAAKVFGINASACLLLVKLTAENLSSNVCKIFSLTNPDDAKNILTCDADFLHGSELDFAGKCCFEWRQGIKHDCAKVLELTIANGHFQNGAGEVVDIEDELIFPLIKSSSIKRAVITDFPKRLLVTQRRVNEDTSHIEADFPKAWSYLNRHEEIFTKRRSSIYRGRPKFSVFGVGDYSFAKYKVVVSGFYKTPLFALIFSHDGKPVMTDDTTYFVGFENFAAAYTAMLFLNSSPVQEFLTATAFLDAKRPYTKKILERIDFAKITTAIQFADLKQTERRLNLSDRLTPSMLAEFVSSIEVQPTLF